jgi:hypothetical protein
MWFGILKPLKMKASETNIKEIFDFKGSWDMPSKCGLRRIEKSGKTVVIVTELYQDNPGSSITSVAGSLATQICERYAIQPERLIYIESNPGMNSKLSFYDEEYYIVNFENAGGTLQNPQWRKLTKMSLLGL